jgi:hypothetical protein
MVWSRKRVNACLATASPVHDIPDHTIRFSSRFRRRIDSPAREGRVPFTRHRPDHRQNGHGGQGCFFSRAWTRRHLTTSQRACAAAEVAERMPETRGRKAGGNTRKNATISDTLKTFAVGERSSQMAREILRENPSLFSQVKAGELTVTRSTQFIPWECQDSGRRGRLHHCEQ